MSIRLQEIVKKIIAADNFNQALDVLVTEICFKVKLEICLCFWFEQELNGYQLLAKKGISQPKASDIFIAKEEGLIGRVGKLFEPINLADMQTDPNYKTLGLVNEEHYHGFLGIPIILKRRVLGVLVVQKQECKKFSDYIVSLLLTLATQLSSHLAKIKAQTEFSRFTQTSIYAFPVSSGVVVSEGWVDNSQPSLDDVFKATALDRDYERKRLDMALETAVMEFQRFSKRYLGNGQQESATIFNLYMHLVSDERLKRKLYVEIDGGAIAEWAIKVTVEYFISKFAERNDPYMRERAADFKTLGQRLLFHLKETLSHEENYPEQFILVTDELTVTLLAELPQERLVGIVARDGTLNSHAVIMVKALRIPMIVGVDIQLGLLAGRTLIVDGYSGELIVSPGDVLINDYQQFVKQDSALKQIVHEALTQETKLKSGETINLFLNIGFNLDKDKKIANHVQGIGLYRSEIAFMLHDIFPSLTEQIKQYELILGMMPDKPTTLRTLDIGADKPLSYLPIDEDNPILGWRGIRITLDQPEIFLMQIKAMLIANMPTGNLRILLPMISSIEEVDEAKQLIDRAWQELVEDYCDIELIMPKIGVMIEVPSLIFLIEYLASRVDFISVGSNDLIQYLLAVDRNNNRVASLYNSLHPAVLKGLRSIVLQANSFNLPISICGEIASEPIAILLLVGMGYRNFSMNSSSVGYIKYLLNKVSLVETEVLIRRVLTAKTVPEIYQLVAGFMEKRGLGGLIRRGI